MNLGLNIAGAAILTLLMLFGIYQFFATYDPSAPLTDSMKITTAYHQAESLSGSIKEVRAEITTMSVQLAELEATKAALEKRVAILEGQKPVTSAASRP